MLRSVLLRYVLLRYALRLSGAATVRAAHLRGLLLALRVELRCSNSDADGDAGQVLLCRCQDASRCVRCRLPAPAASLGATPSRT